MKGKRGLYDPGRYRLEAGLRGRWEELLWMRRWGGLFGAFGFVRRVANGGIEGSGKSMVAMAIWHA